mgnify:CR=1 FL=1
MLALLLSALLAYLPTTYCYSNYTDEAGNEIGVAGPVRQIADGDAAIVLVSQIGDLQFAFILRYGLRRDGAAPPGGFDFGRTNRGT